MKVNLILPKNMFTHPKSNNQSYLPTLDLPVGITPPNIPRTCCCRRRLSPIVENAPITPEEALKRFSSFLMPYETQEILKFNEIYFVGYPDGKNSTPFDMDYYYKANPRDHIAYRYEIVKILGKGSFGEVMEVIDHKAKKRLALKIIISDDEMKEQTKIEADILSKLNRSHATSHSIRGIDFFIFRSHACITFELMGLNLYQVLAKHGFRAMKPSLVKNYARQIFSGLKDIAKLGIIHADLKPENVCLSLEDRNKLKIIDFGSSCYEDKRLYTYIQSRYYRSPEVILQLKYDTKIDVWSAGLIVIELLTGKPLFPGRNEAEMLKFFIQYLGEPPAYLTKISPRRHKFFNDDGSLKKSKLTQSIQTHKSLEKFLGISSSPNLLDFLEKTLQWDPEKRITASEALDHPWLQDEEGPTLKNADSLPSLQKVNSLSLF